MEAENRKAMIRLLALSTPHERSRHERGTRVDHIARLEQFYNVGECHAKRARNVRGHPLRVVFLCLFELNFFHFQLLIKF